jgi:hypothetical protein
MSVRKERGVPFLTIGERLSSSQKDIAYFRLLVSQPVSYLFAVAVCYDYCKNICITASCLLLQVNVET